jgi:protein-tyrosine phosphatase
MLSIFKKKSVAAVDLSELRTDMHSHLLPGIDDGSPDPTTSLRLIAGLKELGYSSLVTTPHVMWDVYRNDNTTIGNAYSQLQEFTPAVPVPVPVRPAAEYFLDDHFDQLLDRNVPLLTIKDNFVLVEFSFVNAPYNYKEKLFDLQIKGYQPVLAHPERYTYFLHHKDTFDELRTAGCMFQLNILSLSGYYGKGPLELCRHFIKNKWVSFLGTDLHHDRHLQALRSAHSLNDTIKSLLDSGTILNPSIT